MNRIFKAIMVLGTLSALSSCYKEPVFEFAENGPEMTVTCDEYAFLGGKIDFTADVKDSEYPLSVINAKLYWDLELGDVVTEVQIRTTTEGTYAGSLSVPFEKALNDGIATVVFKAVNTHLGETLDTVYLAVSRPQFESLTITSGDSWRRSLTPVEGKSHEYAYAGAIPDDFEPYIVTPAIAGKGTEVTFGWNGSEIVVNGPQPIPFDIMGSGTISFNTKTFEGSPFVNITVNGVKAMPVSGGAYRAHVNIAKGAKLEVEGVEDMSQWYVDPDHFRVESDGIYFNAVDGYYNFDMNPEYKFVTVRRADAEGNTATYAGEGAIVLMGWGVAHPVMTSQVGWEGGLYLTLAEVEDGVYQFSGKAVEETDGTTLGGVWRYDYLSFKFFGQAAWGAEYGTVTLTDEAKKYLQNAGNIELAAGVKLELGAEYVMTVTDLTPLDANNKFDCTIDFRKK